MKRRLPASSRLNAHAHRQSVFSGLAVLTLACLLLAVAAEGKDAMARSKSKGKGKSRFIEYEAHLLPIGGESAADDGPQGEMILGLTTGTSTLDVLIEVEHIDPAELLGVEIWVQDPGQVGSKILSYPADQIEAEEEAIHISIGADPGFPFPAQFTDALAQGYVFGLVRTTSAPDGLLRGTLTELKENRRDEELDLSHRPDALDTVSIPTPSNLSDFVIDTHKAEVLGKALFWDMQAGSDGVQACASCHFNGGADIRTRNVIGMPDIRPAAIRFRGTNKDLKTGDFPFHKLKDVTDRDSQVRFDTSEIAGSPGVVAREFRGIAASGAVDHSQTFIDPIFSYRGVNVRQTEPRQALSTINAVFNHRQFWDGRASANFNGVDPFGETNPNARVWAYEGGGTSQVRILIEKSSLASQAVGPPLSDFEMSWKGRTFPDLGRKLLALAPLAQQKVDPNDSVLGPYVGSDRTGLRDDVTYAGLIRDAFHPKWWSAPNPVNGQFTQMEANFSLFWGLAVQIYEATLVSDQSPYDRFARGDSNALSSKQKLGLEIFLKQGRCIGCHGGPEFAGGTFSDVFGSDGSKKEFVEFMKMATGPTAHYDNGFYNIGVRPTAEDHGVGGNTPFGPKSFAKRSQNGEDLGDNHPVGPNERIAVLGAFRAPTLRNIELTGPYMHNGGMKSLQEVVEFYARGGDFRNIADRDPDVDGVGKLRDNSNNIQAVVAFLESLTDPRVRYEKAPFDHPELFIPDGHLKIDTRSNLAIDRLIRIAPTGAGGSSGSGLGVPTFEENLKRKGFPTVGGGKLAKAKKKKGKKNKNDDDDND